MARAKVVKGTADDIVVGAAKNLIHMTMAEAKMHIDKEGFQSIECLNEEGMKRLAVLGRALVAFAEELNAKDGILKAILVESTMEDVINGAEEATEEELRELDDEEEYVPKKNHTDVMFG